LQKERLLNLFGSYARNTNKEDSDIDVAIVVSNISEDFFAVNPLLWKIRRQILRRYFICVDLRNFY
jgi:predicted nucleotidyltransferase